MAALGSSEITYLVDDGGPFAPHGNKGPLVRARVEKSVVTDPTEGHPAPQPPIHSRTSKYPEGTIMDVDIRYSPSFALAVITLPPGGEVKAEPER